MPGKHAMRAALCAAVLVASAGSARALELKDLIIQFDVMSTGTSGTYRSEPRRDFLTINAVAGKMVWLGKTCRGKALDLVYQPGTLTGTIDCPVERTGTAKVWDQDGATATYSTSMTVAGNVVTLQGKMTGRQTSEVNKCGDRHKRETHFDVTQSLTIRITGKTCQVLKINVGSVATERYTYRSDGGDLKTEVHTHSYRPAPNAKCTVRRRSEEPIHPPGGLVSVTREC